MATSEIEKLERRYAENPHGLTFAPLAEVHRKNGDITRALELLRIGLELHPNYIPASIVLGRCHQDLGDLPAAEEAFNHVLRLDDENVIALKSLADINERQDKLEDAERWLRRLVSVDRSNEEAREQLKHLDTLKEQSRRRARAAAKSAAGTESPKDGASTVSPPASQPAAPEAAVPLSAAPQHASVPPATEPPRVPAEPASASLEPIDLTEELSEPAAVEEVPAKVVETPVSAPPEAAKVKAEIPEPAKPEPAEPVRDRPEVKKPEPVSGLVPNEFVPPEEDRAPASPLGLEIETEQDVVLRSSGASEFTVPDASQEFLDLAAKLNASRPRSPGRRASDRAAAERRPPPEPAQPRETPAPLEPTPPAPAPLNEPVAPGRSYVARDTKGQSVAEFFQVLLLARPPEGSGQLRSTTAAEATNQDGRSAPNDSSVSFDDFFGSGTKGSKSPDSSEPSKEDLDQFQSWLQNLKR
jgi:hypothetical protein